MPASKTASETSRVSKARTTKRKTALRARKKGNGTAKGNGKGAVALGAKPEELLDVHRQMLLLRRFEERVGQLYGMGIIGGFCHLYIGQEAVAVGMERAIHPDDSVITAYRCHAHMIARRADPAAVIGELLGKAGGVSRGKGGSMHLFDPARNFYGGHGIVGAQVPLGTGIAFALRYRKIDRVCVTYLGDGALNQGQVAEAFNMAALWKLPVIYVIENNQYGMGTSVVRSAAVTELHRRGESFGIPGRQADGMNPFEVEAVGREAVDFVRAGNGPILLEMRTYRYRGHSMSDPAKYRSREEVEKVRDERDPIDFTKTLLIESGVLDEEGAKVLDREVRESVVEAVTKAQAMPEPEANELFTDVNAPDG